MNRNFLQPLAASVSAVLLIGCCLSCDIAGGRPLNESIEWDTAKDSLSYVFPENEAEYKQLEGLEDYFPNCSLRLSIVYPISIEKRSEKVCDSLSAALLRMALGAEVEEGDVSATLKSYIDNRLQQFISERNDNWPSDSLTSRLASDSWRLGEFIDTELLYDEGNIVSVKVSSWLFEGGARWSSNDRYLNYDLKRRTILTSNDLIIPDKSTEASLFITQQIISELGLVGSEDLEYLGLNDQNNIQLTDNYYFTDQGIVMVFRDASVEIFTTQLREVLLPTAGLLPFIQSKYRYFFE